MAKWLLACALLLTACGGGTDVSPQLSKLCDDPDGPWTAYLAKIAMCQPGVAGTDHAAWGRAPTHAEIIAACRGNLKPYLEDGTIGLPTDAALAACRDYVSSTACTAFDPLEENPCRTLLVGIAGAGTYCERDEQCVGNGYCADAHGTSCGGCKTRQMNGVVCRIDDGCVSGYCSNGMCAAPGDEGATCTSSYGCKGQLVCASGMCAKAPAWAVDTPCTPGDIYQCTTSSGLLTCGAAGKCVAVDPGSTGTAMEGAACGSSAECGPLLVCYQMKCQYAPYSGICPAY